ncbi:alpha-L-iduronidase [Palaemon carinicauda]|uniref:alpha-L-iduronidase n=1 Tax=Palaemon carinicauda TaxID=392227 RepID=UPI0035B67F60
MHFYRLNLRVVTLTLIVYVNSHKPCYGIHVITLYTNKHNVNTPGGHVLNNLQVEHDRPIDKSPSEKYGSQDLPIGTSFRNLTSFTEESFLLRKKNNLFTSALNSRTRHQAHQPVSLESLLQEEENVTLSSETEEIKIFVDGEKTEGAFEHIWRSTGLCPLDPHSEAHLFLLSQDELQNLALIGSLPNDAIEQVRIHWLLDLVSVSVEDAEPKYNFTHLDRLMDHLREFDLKPGFEIMGNPGNIFTDLENVTQVTEWRNLVMQTARRYVEKYGLDWVASWKWETWNEPDHHDFDSLNFTLQGFLNYYDACRMGLDDVSPDIVFGGPGGSCRNPNFSRICWALLDHCDHGSSFFTPGVPPRIDFISFHKKGEQDADTILEKELPTVAQIYDEYPSLRQVPVINDEADFEVGWSRGREWRADARYAALAVRSVYIHQLAKDRIPHFKYALMSFDNAFLNYRPHFFDQRTILTRFQINNTTPHQVQFVKKPAYTIMALLSLLGDQVLSHSQSFVDKRLSVLSTCRNCFAANSVDRGSVRDAKRGFDAARSIGIDNQSPRLVIKTGTIEEDPTAATGSRKSSGPKNKSEELDNRRLDEHYENSAAQLFASNNKRTSATGYSPGRSGTQSDEDEYFSYSLTSDGRSGMLGSSVTSQEWGKTKSDGSGVGALWEATLVVSSSNGTEKNKDEIVKLKISFALPKFLVGKNLSMATYRLGADVKGPYEAWLELGSPIEPNRTELAYIRSFEGASRDGPRLLQAVPPTLDFKANLTMPGVLFIELCEQGQSNPGQVTNVSTINVTSMDVLITWSDTFILTRCVWYYEVQRSQVDKNGPYWTISSQNVTDNNFIYSLTDASESVTVDGWYRVRVVTLWESTGDFSDPVHHHV